MALTVQADDGDELSIQPFQLCDEQILVRLQLQNNAHVGGGDFDWVTLTPEQARELGRALVLAADMIEPVTSPAGPRTCN